MNENYTYPVHKSITKRNLVMGLPLLVLIGIIMVTAFFYILLDNLIFIPFGIIIYFIAREITKKDEYFLEILFNSLLQPHFLN